MQHKTAIVIGAGIVGLATARALAIEGYAVTVIERNHKAVGASVRNFGMVWPIGQPGDRFDIAMHSRSIWKSLCDEAGIWYDPVGSLHSAYHTMEWQVLQECHEAFKDRGYTLVDAANIHNYSAVAEPIQLQGALYSKDEIIVDSRKAIATIPLWLHEKHGVEFIWGKTVTDIAYPAVYAGKDIWEADVIYVCSGPDIETLYPEEFQKQDIVTCKLQMMRLAEQPQRMGPALCGGLSLIHYNSFAVAPSLPVLKKLYEDSLPEYIQYGIHVMAAQNEAGEITIGDSHEYGNCPDPFDKIEINKLIAGYLKKLARFKNEVLIESWNGVYPKLMDGRTHFTTSPESGVIIINGLGGAGMTMSFAICEREVKSAAR